MSARIINHEKFLAIFRLRAEGLSYKAIAEQVGVGEETVRRYVVGEANDRTKRDPRRCRGCGAIILTHKCLKCELDSGRLKHRTVGATEDVPGMPNEDEIAARAAAIRDAAIAKMQGRVRSERTKKQNGDYEPSIREYGFSTRHNGRLL